MGQVVKLWLKFQKTGKMKYISYLDLLSVLARALKRTGLELELSKGYNPQPKISFAHPLPLGIDSLRDYGEIELVNQQVPDEEQVARVNHELPEGFEILDMKQPKHVKPPKLMSLVEASSYVFNCEKITDKEELRKAVNFVNNNETIEIQKWNNKKRKWVKKDIKPMIFELELEGPSLFAVFQAGSQGNLRPDEFIGAIFEGNELFEFVTCSRTELYFVRGEDQDKELLSLWQWDEVN